MVLSDTPYIHVEYYPAHNVIVTQWYAHCTSREYRNALNRFLAYVTSMDISYAIADRRLLPPLPPEDTRWTLTEYIEDFKKLPLKRFAIINSFDPAASTQVQEFIHNKANPLPFEVRVFEDLTSAYDWLIEDQQK
ncbi:hypothetical protein [Pontibacter oryzae]|uniref:STAS/SEC14 domain-containing protein n=1 Tax=Pontibacter oryzae TaxID=2304593 RepID=A0A399S011_9BACT|nr:hypothetical protein [Pontibacter oryzae]RIJ37336.1 hypothetical protein D1627_09355 [Pontibacter oryzae]